MTSSDWDWGLPVGQANEAIPDSLKSKCTCGASKAMGKDDHWSFHSDYCDLANQTTFYFTHGDKEVKQ